MRTAWQFSAVCYAVVLVLWYVSRIRSWKPPGFTDAPFRWKLANFHLMSYGVLDAILAAGFLVSLFNATLLVNV